MQSLFMNRVFSVNIVLRGALATAALSSALFVAACGDPDVDINDLTVDPDSANKGETLAVKGNVGSLAKITSVTFTVLDEKDAPLDANAGISVSNVALAKDRISWDLRSDADAKIVTSASSPSGKYHLKVEAKTDAKTNVEMATFSIR